MVFPSHPIIGRMLKKEYRSKYTEWANWPTLQEVYVSNCLIIIHLFEMSGFWSQSVMRGTFFGVMLSVLSWKHFSRKQFILHRYRLHDIALVAQHGGILHQGSIDHTLTGIDELIDMLKNGTIDGFLLDRNSFYYFSKRTKEQKYRFVFRIHDKIEILLWLLC